MNIFAITFLFMDSVLLLVLPRKWASLPLLSGACYIAFDQAILLGPFNFTAIRIILAVGFIRVILRRERIIGVLNGLDWLIVASAIWALISSFTQESLSEALKFRFGFIYNTCGVYFLFRILCQSYEDLKNIILIASFVLVPVALEMIYEKITGHNLFSLMSEIDVGPAIRGGKIRAQGPFAHAILAGSVGAVFCPMIIGIWKKERRAAAVGILACLIMVYASSSSGPILSAMAGIVAILMYRYRFQMRIIQGLMVISYIVLNMIMQAPAYYLLTRLDITGGSTGWHRARLIETAFEHLSEWWLGGTEYTAHWMPTGVYWSEKHADITNHYLRLGVIGGLPLMLLTITVILVGFRFVGQKIWECEKLYGMHEAQFMLWVIGASLFAHAVTCIGVSYYDQSFLFLYLNLALIGSIKNFKKIA